MRKFSPLFVMLIVLLVLWTFVSCDTVTDLIGGDGGTPIKYTVTFDINGGNGAVPGSITDKKGISIKLPKQGNLRKDGHIFGGWNTNQAGTGINYPEDSPFPLTGNDTLYAKWDAETVTPSTTFTVNFNANGGNGSPPPSITVNSGEIIQLPGQGSLTRGGYRFAGWNTEANGSGRLSLEDSFIMPSGSFTLYAHWDTIPDPALKAEPIAASTSAPKILDSYMAGTKNYYLIDVGYIRNTYISDIVAPVHYNGMTSMSLSKTTVTEGTITKAMKETVSSSITVSDTQNHTVGIEGAWEKEFPVAGKFSVKLSYEWSGSWTNSNTSGKSNETSVSETQRYADSLTISFTIGEKGEPVGYYRYSLYAVSDVYFIISTSLDNQQLLSWDTVVCARDVSYLPHMDYSPDGNFDNSPDRNDITFAENFYKTLPKPTINFGFPVTNTAQWNEAISYIRNGGSGTAGTPKTYIINVIGSVNIPGSAAASTSFGSVQNVEVTLKGSGKLSLNSNGSVLRLENNQKLIIDDENLTLQGRSGNNSAVMTVGSGGTLELKNGTISGNSTSGRGGGVNTNTGTFNMSGGIITGNKASREGGGVYIDGGSSFAKTGGTITGSNDSNGNRADYRMMPGVTPYMGHAVCVVDNSSIFFNRYRNDTVGPTINLFYSNGTFSGDWES